MGSTFQILEIKMKAFLKRVRSVYSVSNIRNMYRMSPRLTVLTLAGDVTIVAVVVSLIIFGVRSI